MIDSLNQVSLFAAFSAGLLSFISPCVLPLVPSYVSYITGLSLEQLTDVAERQRFRKAILLNSLLFILGFSTVFIAFGASASFVGQVLFEYQDIIRKFGAVLIIIFGLYMLGVLKMDFLMREYHLVQFNSRPVGYAGSFLIGTAFAAAWTPCVGPILGAILAYASTTESMKDGIFLLASYSVGLGLPLFITAFSVESFLNYFKKAQVYIRGVSVVGGAFLIMAGVMIYGDSLTRLTSFLERNGIGWYIGL
jgi:cytochrome c-type biogenesis protein